MEETRERWGNIKTTEKHYRVVTIDWKEERIITVNNDVKDACKNKGETRYNCYVYVRVYTYTFSRILTVNTDKIIFQYN